MKNPDPIESLAQSAKAASRPLSLLTAAAKNQALISMAQGLIQDTPNLLAANEKDLAAAEKKGHTKAFLDRLKLTPQRIEAMAQGLREVAELPDPVGEITGMWRRPNGLLIGKMRMPIGVIAIIYESRPNVTAEAAALCLKSGNAVILRGGSEAIHSNTAIARILATSAYEAGLPRGCLAMVETTEREAVQCLLKLDKLIDLVIPRGGSDFIQMVRENSSIPIIAHDKGLCHTYVDQGADLVLAQKVVHNAKVQRPGVCNAMETLLVHQETAAEFLPPMAAILQEAGVELRGCPRTQKLVAGIKAATEEDWNTEYLDLILSVKVVDSLEEAIAHIQRYSSGLAEAIVTRDNERAWRFLREVDSSTVFVNTSTRFTDGGQFGLGAEIGISTQKLHARGPMGLKELTAERYIVLGEGQVRTA